MLYQIHHETQLLAIIIPHSFSKPGIHFVTPYDFSQQLAYMSHPAGQSIRPHVHNRIEREVHFTLEVLFLKRGKLRVDFYSADQKYVESFVLEAGDTILLASGGHGFEVLEEVEFIEVKQGPYEADRDKTRFEGISADQVVLRERIP